MELKLGISMKILKNPFDNYVDVFFLGFLPRVHISLIYFFLGGGDDFVASYLNSSIHTS